ncbi:MAG: dTMP kinase [Pseudomonadales bacterium]|nr:dTMP kinase [Pseudomonadales bacterium]
MLRPEHRLGSRLLTLEGGEGAGKTSCLSCIRDYFERRRLPYWVSREPGGTAMAEEIRELMLRPRAETVEALTELFLVFAARTQHLSTVIRPHLEAGEWVILDRFTDASYAYQGGGRGVDEHIIANLESWVQGELRPGLVLWLDVPLEVGIKRVQERGGSDRMDNETRDFMLRVHDAYRRRFQSNPITHRRIDAGQPLDRVMADLVLTLDEYLVGALT